MRKPLLVFLLFFLVQEASAQYGLQLNAIAPAGNYGYIFKRAPGVEAKISGGKISNRFKFGFTLGFYALRPTQDTFPIYGTQTGGTTTNIYSFNGSTQFQPGYEIIYNYRVLSAGLWSDLKLIDRKFSPTIGLDAYAYIITTNETYSVENQVTVQGKYENELTYAFAVAPKLGLSYEHKKKWLFSGGLSRSMAFYGTAVPQAYWKTYLCVLYYFD